MWWCLCQQCGREERLPFDHPDVERTLDNLYAAAAGEPRPHEDLRPFRGE